MKTTQRYFRSPVFLLSFALLLFAHCTARAQSTTGDLQFIVTDTLGEPVPGVNAIVTGIHLQGSRGASGDNRGFCNLLALPPGTVSLRVSHTAYQSVIVNDVHTFLAAKYRILPDSGAQK